jgi:hypothetical protein
MLVAHVGTARVRSQQSTPVTRCCHLQRENWSCSHASRCSIKTHSATRRSASPARLWRAARALTGTTKPQEGRPECQRSPPPLCRRIAAPRKPFYAWLVPGVVLHQLETVLRDAAFLPGVAQDNRYHRSVGQGRLDTHRPLDRWDNRA